MSEETTPQPEDVQVDAQLEKKSPIEQLVFTAKQKFPEAIEEVLERLSEVTILVKRDHIVDICKFFRDEEQFDLLSDLVGVDRGIEEELRFEVNYHLTSLPKRLRLRLKVRVSEEDCSVPTVTELWPTANWHERETFDLVGIRFEGHPDLRKILTPPDLEGHPLRKDFPLRGY